MTNVLLAGFTSHWHRRKSSMRTIPGEKPPALRGCPQLRSVPSLWSGMREQSCSIPRGLKINKNSAEGEVFLVDFPSYRTLQAQVVYNRVFWGPFPSGVRLGDDLLCPSKIELWYQLSARCDWIDGPCGTFFPGASRRGDNTDIVLACKRSVCGDDDV